MNSTNFNSALLINYQKKIRMFFCLETLTNYDQDTLTNEVLDPMPSHLILSLQIQPTRVM